MKALFLIFHGFAPYDGISKKIGYQKEAFQKNGLDIRLCYLRIDQEGNHQRIIDDQVLENFGKGVRAKFKKRFCYQSLLNYMKTYNVQLLYIRSYHNSNPFLNHFLKKLAQLSVKVVLEIPTYPYDQEYRQASRNDKVRLFTDQLFRKRQARYLTRIVTFSNDKKIFNVPTIRISNGIDFSHIKLKNIEHTATELKLLGVANIHFWHGYDRIINGLVSYYQTQPSVTIFFTIVGYGPEVEINRLQQLISKNQLQSYVSLKGPKSGNELDELFNQADIGIGSLARHRSHITSIKTLKNREYAARGIPFVYSETDDDFDQMPYILKVPADESPIDMQQLIDFYNSQNRTPEQIRSSVYPRLSWTNQMKKILAKLEDDADEEN